MSYASIKIKYLRDQFRQRNREVESLRRNTVQIEHIETNIRRQQIDQHRWEMQSILNVAWATSDQHIVYQNVSECVMRSDDAVFYTFES